MPLRSPAGSAKQVHDALCLAAPPTQQAAEQVPSAAGSLTQAGAEFRANRRLTRPARAASAVPAKRYQAAHRSAGRRRVDGCLFQAKGCDVGDRLCMIELLFLENRNAELTIDEKGAITR